MKTTLPQVIENRVVVEIYDEGQGISKIHLTQGIVVAPEGITQREALDEIKQVTEGVKMVNPHSWEYRSIFNILTAHGFSVVDCNPNRKRIVIQQ